MEITKRTNVCKLASYIKDVIGFASNSKSPTDIWAVTFKNGVEHDKEPIKEGILKDKCYECGISEWRGKKLSLHLDHINGDTSDNRIENLREATAAQNMQNRKTFANNKSGHKGVAWSKFHSKWFVYMR